MKRKNAGMLIHRFFAYILAFTVAALIVSYAGESVNAETLPGYSADAAIQYAKSTFAKNTNYKDCVRFVRKCAEAGGVPAQKNRSYEFSASQYMDYLISNGYAVKNRLALCEDVTVYGSMKYGNMRVEDNTGKLAKGDLLAYYCKNCKKYFHMAVVTETDEGYDGNHYWILYAQSARGQMIGNLPFYRYKHSSCGKSDVEVYALHFTSEANGFTACDKTVKTLKAKKITAKKAKLSWKKCPDAVAYNIYARGYTGGPVEFIKQVKGTSSKVAIPKNKKGQYYNYKNVRFTIAPVFEQTVSFEGRTSKYKVIGKKRALVKVK